MLKDFFDSHPDIYRNYYPKNENIDETYLDEEYKENVGVIKKSTILT